MTDLMDKIYETTEVSDVISDNCTKSSLTSRKSNFERTKQYWNHQCNWEYLFKDPILMWKKNIFCKNKTKIALPDQYSMSFPNNPKVIYILVSIKIHIRNDMDQGHYVCDVLEYNTGTWWNCYGEKVTQYSGYTMNVYND